MQTPGSSATTRPKRSQVIAYFSAEFGLHEALPIYSGGLGVLSGDHCKAASDLDLPFIGVGFLYPQGYFIQRIDADGMQHAIYEKVDFAEVPATPALGPDGKEVLINVDLPGRTVYAKIWKIQVGRIPIYLMDTDVERNAPQDRELSARLYGGDREMRISQEIVLGIGGVRAVRALGYQPCSLAHERRPQRFPGPGTGARKGAGRWPQLSTKQSKPFAQTAPSRPTRPCRPATIPLALRWSRSSSGSIGASWASTATASSILPARNWIWGPQYSMTVLAINLSAYHNGVSELHGHVSRGMWEFLWPDTPVEQVPIGHVTNGVHTKTWMVQEIKDLYNRYLDANWRDEVDDPKIWAKVDEIPDDEVWAAHVARKHKLVDFVRDRVQRQYLRHGEGPQRVNAVDTLLDPNALTIGFARRFATYKRATLIFRDEERLLRLLNDPQRPLQFVFSGKAHPADEPGKALIQHIYHLSQTPEFARQDRLR